MKPRVLTGRKILIASIGVATVTYACGGDTNSGVGSDDPMVGQGAEAGTSGSSSVVKPSPGGGSGGVSNGGSVSAGGSISGGGMTSGNLMPPPPGGMGGTVISAGGFTSGNLMPPPPTGGTGGVVGVPDASPPPPPPADAGADAAQDEADGGVIIKPLPTVGNLMPPPPLDPSL